MAALAAIALAESELDEPPDAGGTDEIEFAIKLADAARPDASLLPIEANAAPSRRPIEY